MRNIILALAVFIVMPVMAQPDAKAIFEKATSQLVTTNLELSMDVEAIDKKGRSKFKSFKITMAKIAEVYKTKIVIEQPERAKGVTIIISDFTNKEGIIEVFTPANGKVRKMKSTPENMALVGFDFFVTDFISQDEQELTFKYLDKITHNEQACNKIEVSSKENADGEKAQLIISEEDSQIVQLIMLDAQNKKISVTEFQNDKAVVGAPGKVQAMIINTEDLVSGKKNKVKILKAEIIPNLKAEDFMLEEQKAVAKNKKLEGV